MGCPCTFPGRNAARGHSLCKRCFVSPRRLTGGTVRQKGGTVPAQPRRPPPRRPHGPALFGALAWLFRLLCRAAGQSRLAVGSGEAALRRRRTAPLSRQIRGFAAGHDRCRGPAAARSLKPEEPSPRREKSPDMQPRQLGLVTESAASALRFLAWVGLLGAPGRCPRGHAWGPHGTKGGTFATFHCAHRRPSEHRGGRGRKRDSPRKMCNAKKSWRAPGSAARRGSASGSRAPLVRSACAALRARRPRAASFRRATCRLPA